MPDLGFLEFSVMTKELHFLITEAKTIVDGLQELGLIEDYITLFQAVLRKELLDEINKLENLLNSTPNSLIKQEFEKLCLMREEQNKGTKLHFVTSPETICNTLYFNFAKTLYQTDSFSTLCPILLPSIKNIWIATLALEALHENSYETPHKKRLTQVVNLEVVKNNAVELETMVLKPESFKRFVICDADLFILDTLESFNFDLHCETHKILMEKAPKLCQAIATHNTSFTELYSVIVRCHEQGATILNTMLPLIQIMSISGERLGHGKFASDEGTQAAEQLISYYHHLPKPLKKMVGECTTAATQNSLATVIHKMEQQDCIETCATQLLAIVGDKTNGVMQSMPFMSDDEKKALCLPYKQIKKGECIVNLTSGLLIPTLPCAITAYFYPQIMIDNLDLLVGILTTFPTTEYVSIFRHVDLTDLNFRTELRLITPALNAQQKEALAITLQNSLTNQWITLKPSDWFIACILTEDQEFIDQLFKNYTEEQRLTILSETDHFGCTPMHYIAEGKWYKKNNTTIFKILMQLYPDDNKVRLQALRGQRDNQGRIALHCLAKNAELMELLIPLYLTQEKGREMLLVDLLTKLNDGKNVLHLAASSKSIKVIMEFFIAQNLNDCLNPLAEIDVGHNTVLHHAIGNLEIFSFLLNSYTNVNHCVATLLKRNKKGETACHTRTGIFYETVSCILNFLIERNAKNLCVQFLQNPITLYSKSPLAALAGQPKGIAILMDLLGENTKSIIKDIPLETWTKTYNEPSIIYQLTLTAAGIGFLLSLLTENPVIKDYLTPENCLLLGIDHTKLNNALLIEERLRVSSGMASALSVFNSPPQDHTTLLAQPDTPTLG